VLRKRKRIGLLALFCLFTLLAAGCGSPTKNEETAQSSTPVSYRLKWLFNASTAGDLWAKEKGLFANYGLKVTVKEGGAEQDAIEELELGRVQFGVASADQVLRAVSRGADVLVLAQIFQINPLQWIYMKSRVDLEGLDKGALKQKLPHLTVGITYGGNDEAIFMALVKSLGLEPESLNIYAITYDYTPFWKGEVDLWPCYRNTQGITLSEKMKEMGDKPGFLNPADYGISFVANSLITTKRFAKRHPETVKLFTKCILEAWHQALMPENRKEMVSILERYEKTISPSSISKQLEATRELVTDHGQREIGYIDQNAWAQTEDVMFQQGLIKKRVDVTKLFMK